MGKPKLRPIAAIMKIIESVPGDAREELEADLRDLLRPAPKPRQKATAAKCKHCQKTAAAAIHVVGSNRYGHPFESSTTATGSKTAQKQRAGKGSVTVPLEPCAKFGCGNYYDHNSHHLTTRGDYHEFVEPVGEAKGAGV